MLINDPKGMWANELLTGKNACRNPHTGELYWLCSRKVGKNPGLTFWIDESNKDMLFSEGALTPMIVDGKIWVMEGNLFGLKSGKIGPVFKPKAYRPTHMLVCVQWGGPNNETRGLEWETLSKKAKYSKRWESPAGGLGENWYIFLRDFSMEDMINDSIPPEIFEEEKENDE